MELKPVGQRPKCLECRRELKPKFKQVLTPINVDTGETASVRKSSSYGTGVPEYEQGRIYRPTTEAERKQFRKVNPRQFLGSYGGYGDNRFCGLSCGYKWAVRNSFVKP